MVEFSDKLEEGCDDLEIGLKVNLRKMILGCLPSTITCSLTLTVCGENI